MPVNIFPLVVFDFGAFGFSIIQIPYYIIIFQSLTLCHFASFDWKFLSNGTLTAKGQKMCPFFMWELICMEVVLLHTEWFVEYFHSQTVYQKLCE